jgi:hypothetical protein
MLPDVDERWGSSQPRNRQQAVERDDRRDGPGEAIRKARSFFSEDESMSLHNTGPQRRGYPPATVKVEASDLWPDRLKPRINGA